MTGGAAGRRQREVTPADLAKCARSTAELLQGLVAMLRVYAEKEMAAFTADLKAETNGLEARAFGVIALLERLAERPKRGRRR